MLKNQDLNMMQTYGRYVARDNDQAALDKAVEYMLIADPATDDAQRLTYWFHEGVRNYAKDQNHTDACMSMLQAGVTLADLKVLLQG